MNTSKGKVGSKKSKSGSGPMNALSAGNQGSGGRTKTRNPKGIQRQSSANARIGGDWDGAKSSGVGKSKKAEFDKNEEIATFLKNSLHGKYNAANSD
jgi:hypothetical protein